MRRERTWKIVGAAIIAVFLGLSILTLFWDAPFESIFGAISDHLLLIAIVFTGLMFLGTVLAPLTTVVVVPIVATIVDPFVVALLSIVGWTTGSMVAFLIARRFGRPLVKHFIDISAIEKYESHISDRTEFFTFVLLRMVVPPDVLSYAAGLVSKMPFGYYSLATVIGVAPFAFIFAYGGSAFKEGRYIFLVALGLLGVVLFTLVWRFLKRS